VAVPVVILTGTGYGLIALNRRWAEKLGEEDSTDSRALLRGKFLTPQGRTRGTSAAPDEGTLHSGLPWPRSRQTPTHSGPSRRETSSKPETRWFERLTKAGDTAEARRISRLRRPSQWYGRSTEWLRVTRMTSEPWQARWTAFGVHNSARVKSRGRPTSIATQFQRLVTRANELLREGSQAVTPALERRMRSTLQAAVADRRLRRDLQSAQLGEEHADPGFAVFTRGPIPTEFLRPSPKSAARTRLPTDSPPTARSSAGAVSARREQAARKVEARRQAQARPRDSQGGQAHQGIGA